MSDELKPTSGATMRKLREEGAVVPFPSGNNYRVRLVGAARLLRRGNLPNILLSYVIDAIYNGVTEEKMDVFLSLQEREEHALEFLKSLQVVCEEMFMEPRVVDDPKADDEVSIYDIALQDQGWAFKLAFAPAEALRPFRPQPKTHVVSVQELADVPQAA